MPFTPGKSGNPLGRPVGSPNRTTKEMRLVFQNFVEDNLERLQADFDELTPSERINFLLKLIPSFLPPPPPEETDPWAEPDPWGFNKLTTPQLITFLDAYERVQLSQGKNEGNE